MDQSLEQRIVQDIKTAMLAGDATRVTTLRGLKSAILNVKVAEGTRDSDMPDEKVQQILSKESKKRQESADLYVQGGNQEKADAELSEKALIDAYLPAQLSEDEISEIVAATISEVGANGPSDMGKIMAAVRAKTGSTADGSVVARLVKERLAG